jgi:hypothetical protein
MPDTPLVANLVRSWNSQPTQANPSSSVSTLTLVEQLSKRLDQLETAHVVSAIASSGPPAEQTGTRSDTYYQGYSMQSDEPICQWCWLPGHTALFCAVRQEEVGYQSSYHKPSYQRAPDARSRAPVATGDQVHPSSYRPTYRTIGMGGEGNQEPRLNLIERSQRLSQQPAYRTKPEHSDIMSATTPHELCPTVFVGTNLTQAVPDSKDGQSTDGDAAPTKDPMA